MEEIKSKYNSIMKEKSATTNEFQLIKQQYEELSMRFRDSSNNTESLEEELAELQRILADRTKETNSIKKIMNDKDEMYQSKILELEEKIKSIKASNENTVSDLHANIKKGQREIDELKSINQNYLLKINDLEKNYNELRARQSKLFTEGDTDDSGNSELIQTLRSSLQDSKKKIQEFENSHSVLKKLNEENNLKFERLSKNYKLLTQQYKILEQSKAQEKEKDNRSLSSNGTSRASSVEITRNEANDTNMAYLKNVLLGFFEHKEQRDQLLPVLKTLFHFTAEDEKKLLLALK